MPLLQSNALTLSEWAKRQDPDGKTAKVIEMLSQTNEILDDMLFIEGNLPTGHRTTMRTGLPTVAWRLINQGVQPSKSKTAQSDEAVGMLEAYSEVDKDLAELQADVGAFRLSEAQAFLEAMNQEMASTVFYGNSSVSPEEFTGLAVRYSSLSAANAQNIVVGGGTSTGNTSIWLIGWGEQTCVGIFPKGSKAGIFHEDLGLVTVQDTNGIAGNRLRAYQEHFQWKCGIALKDWRYVVRIPNIDVANLVANSSAADLQELMIKALHRIPYQNMAKLCFYMNRTCFQYLDLQRRADVIAGGQLSYDVVDGKRIPMFRGVPIKIVDAILENEARVQ
jgi:hypothetical protein